MLLKWKVIESENDYCELKSTDGAYKILFVEDRVGCKVIFTNEGEELSIDKLKYAISAAPPDNYFLELISDIGKVNNILFTLYEGILFLVINNSFMPICTPDDFSMLYFISTLDKQLESYKLPYLSHDCIKTYAEKLLVHNDKLLDLGLELIGVRKYKLISQSFMSEG